MSKTYSEKLKDPRWQKKRLEVFNAADWKCQQCGNTHEPLHVHHKQYKTGAEPWEYSGSELMSLCETCHSSAHGIPVHRENVVFYTITGVPFPPDKWFTSWDEVMTFCVMPRLFLECEEGLFYLSLHHPGGRPPDRCEVAGKYLPAIKGATQASILFAQRGESFKIEDTWSKE